jgi:di/tricarboxylate transporter
MSVHTLHLIIVFALVALVFIAFLRELFSPDLVALSALGLLMVTGILSTDETLKVFSNSAPIVIGCMFVLSAALERTETALLFCDPGRDLHPHPTRWWTVSPATRLDPICNLRDHPRWESSTRPSGRGICS